MAVLALSMLAGFGGVVCSPQEVTALRAAHPHLFTFITPVIRPAGGATADQAREMIPQRAIAARASRLVIGRCQELQPPD